MTSFNLKVLSVFVVFSSSAFADTYSAKLYEQGSKQSKLLFNLQTVTTEEGGSTKSSAVFSDPQGTPAFRESAILDGAKIIKSSVEQLQTNTSAVIEVKGDKVHFTVIEGGKTETAQEKLGKTLVVPANFQRFIATQWEPLAAGKTIEFRWGVWSRKETVGFEMFKIAEEKYNGMDLLVFKMKPSSFIIAALVKPILFKFDKATKRLMVMDGRVSPKKKEADGFKDLDAEVIYTYL